MSKYYVIVIGIETAMYYMACDDSKHTGTLRVTENNKSSENIGSEDFPHWSGGLARYITHFFVMILNILFYSHKCT